MNAIKSDFKIDFDQKNQMTVSQKNPSGKQSSIAAPLMSFLAAGSALYVGALYRQQKNFAYLDFSHALYIAALSTIAGASAFFVSRSQQSSKEGKFEKVPKEVLQKGAEQQPWSKNPAAIGAASFIGTAVVTHFLFPPHPYTCPVNPNCPDGYLCCAGTP